MNNNYYNPDYPTNVGNFVQHTYESNGNPYDQTFYYGGGSINPFGDNQMSPIPPDSRRNMFGNTNPQQFNDGYVQPNRMGIPEQQVQPFSSYPSGTPSNNPGNVPFNSLIESRRNLSQPPAMPVQQNQQVNPVFNNPWAVQPVGTVNPNFTNPYGDQNNYGYPYVEMGTSSLYGRDPNRFTFDRKQGCWDNMYTTPRAPIAPDINWNNNNAPTNLNPMGQVQQAPYQNIVQYPKTNESWIDMANKIWK